MVKMGEHLNFELGSFQYMNHKQESKMCFQRKLIVGYFGGEIKGKGTIKITRSRKVGEGG